MVAERVLFDTESEAFTISAFSSGAEAGALTELCSRHVLIRSRDTDISDMTVTYLVYPIQKCFDRVFVEKRGFFR